MELEDNLVLVFAFYLVWDRVICSLLCDRASWLMSFPGNSSLSTTHLAVEALRLDTHPLSHDPGSENQLLKPSQKNRIPGTTKETRI